MIDKASEYTDVPLEGAGATTPAAASVPAGKSYAKYAAKPAAGAAAPGQPGQWMFQ